MTQQQLLTLRITKDALEQFDVYVAAGNRSHKIRELMAQAVATAKRKESDHEQPNL